MNPYRFAYAFATAGLLYGAMLAGESMAVFFDRGKMDETQAAAGLGIAGMSSFYRSQIRRQVR